MKKKEKYTFLIFSEKRRVEQIEAVARQIEIGQFSFEANWRSLRQYQSVERL